jgi:hypothetical protein
MLFSGCNNSASDAADTVSRATKAPTRVPKIEKQ